MNIFSVIRPPDYLTLLNLICGFSAIFVSSLSASGMSMSLQLAVILIIFSAIADGLDGFMARKLGGSQLGAQLDSLADLISFGLAPVFIAQQAFEQTLLFFPIGILYLSFGALRLARFNLSTNKDGVFEGLPIPAAGILLSVSVILGKPILTLSMMIVLSFLMVSSISYPKIRDWRVAIILGCAFFVTAILIWWHQNALFAILLLISIMLIYLASPVVNSRIQKGK